MKLNSNYWRPGTPKTRVNRAPWIFLMRFRSTRLQSRPASQSLNDLRYRLPFGGKKYTAFVAPVQITDARTGQERLVFPGSREELVERALRFIACTANCQGEADTRRRNGSP